MATSKKKSKKNSQNKKCIAIVYRPDKPEAFSYAQKIADWLSDKGFTIYTQSHQKFDSKQKSLTDKKNINKLDLVIVLGGDGTYLHAVHLLEGKPIPILGVNMGSLGFLTNIKSEHLFESIIYTLEGKMELRPRTMLAIELAPQKGRKKKFMALNDVVIGRGSFSQLITLSFKYQDFHVSDLKADGVVISTPTGSTAYNLAAGGPILHPESSSIVVTPISPHSLTNRPMVFSDNSPMSFSIGHPSQQAVLTIDGQISEELLPGDIVTVNKHANNHLFVRHPTHNYFELLREKLKFGERN